MSMQSIYQQQEEAHKLHAAALQDAAARMNRMNAPLPPQVVPTPSVTQRFDKAAAAYRDAEAQLTQAGQDYQTASEELEAARAELQKHMNNIGPSTVLGDYCLPAAQQSLKNDWHLRQGDK